MGYSSVVDMIRAMDGIDSDFVDLLEKEISDKKYSTTLSAIRCLSGKPYEYISSNLGISVNQVKLIESEKNLLLSARTFFLFIKACGFEIMMRITDEVGETKDFDIESQDQEDGQEIISSQLSSRIVEKIIDCGYSREDIINKNVDGDTVLNVLSDLGILKI